jgi:hypothetical protein
MRCRRFETDRVKNREAHTSYWISPPLIPVRSDQQFEAMQSANITALTANSAKPSAKNINSVLTSTLRLEVSS